MELIADIHSAAFLIAGLVREGVTFKAVQQGDKVIITLTGGY